VLCDVMVLYFRFDHGTPKLCTDWYSFSSTALLSIINPSLLFKHNDRRSMNLMLTSTSIFDTNVHENLSHYWSIHWPGSTVILFAVIILWSPDSNHTFAQSCRNFAILITS